MNIEQLKILIAKSNILTDAERTYWTQSLSKMNAQQLQRLEHILTKAQQIPWTKQVKNYFTFIAESAKLAVSGM